MIEGDPLSEPPTLPNAAFSRDYLQPIFEWDEESQWVKVSDYVENVTNSFKTSIQIINQLFAPKALFDRCQITKSAPEKQVALDIHIYPYITLARLFEGLDEVWDNNVRPLKKKSR